MHSALGLLRSIPRYPTPISRMHLPDPLLAVLYLLGLMRLRRTAMTDDMDFHPPHVLFRHMLRDRVCLKVLQRGTPGFMLFPRLRSFHHLLGLAHLVSDKRRSLRERKSWVRVRRNGIAHRRMLGQYWTMRPYPRGYPRATRPRPVVRLVDSKQFSRAFLIQRQPHVSLRIVFCSKIQPLM